MTHTAPLNDAPPFFSSSNCHSASNTTTGNTGLPSDGGVSHVTVAATGAAAPGSGAARMVSLRQDRQGT